MNEVEKQKALTDKLLYFLKGDQNAVDFCVNLTYIAHLWDDLIDKNIQRSDADINDAFRAALIDIPCNPFYVHFRTHLAPLMQSAILQWEDANILERGSDHDKHMAYMLRASFLQIFCFCAYLIGGSSWARQVGPEMRRLYEETLESFMEEMKNA
jgi:hypothetical protein